MRLGLGTAMALMHSNRKIYMGNTSTKHHKFFLFFGGEMPDEGQIKASLSGKSLSPGTGASSTDYVSGQKLLEDNSENLIAVHSTYNRTYPHVDGSPSEEITLDLEAELPITVDLSGRGTQVPFTCFNPGKVTWFAHIVCDPSKSDINPFTTTIFKADTRCVHVLVGSVGLSDSGADLELSTTDFVHDPKGLFFPKFVKFNMKIGQQTPKIAEPTPGESVPLASDRNVEFYGEVLASDFVLYKTIQERVLPIGSRTEASASDAWLKFKVDGKTLYLSKKWLTSKPVSNSSLNPVSFYQGKSSVKLRLGRHTYRLRHIADIAEIQATLWRLAPSNDLHPVPLAEYTPEEVDCIEGTAFAVLPASGSGYQYWYSNLATTDYDRVTTRLVHYRPVLELIE